MKSASLLLACLLLFQSAVADQIELIVGNEVNAATMTKLRHLNMMGSSGVILNRRPGPSVFIDRTEYISEDGNFVVAVEVTCDPLRNEGQSLLTKVYFSNIGERVSKKDSEWMWLDATRVIIDTKTWKASIQNGEQAGAGQPATAPESKSEGGENPQPESKPASR